MARIASATPLGGILGKFERVLYRAAAVQPTAEMPWTRYADRPVVQASKVFWRWLSATTPMPNNGAASGASNLGPTNPALLDHVRARIAALRAVNPANPLPIPVELVTASASGLDPHVSPAAALYQVTRVARWRRMDSVKLRELVLAHVEGRQWGMFGEPRVNALLLNMALDRAQ